MKIFGAYLEDYHFVKVIIPANEKFKKLTLIGNAEEHKLNVFKQEIYSNERHLYCSFLGYICLHVDYFVEVELADSNILKYYLNLGKITRTKRFDLENYTTEALGVIYNKDYSIFRVWSPVAKEIKVVVNNETIPLKYTSKGVWELVLNGDYLYNEYYYLVRVNQEFVKTLDPYAKASTPNFTSSIIVDLSKTYQPKYSYVHHNDPIIEEISIRDITSLNNGGTFADLINTLNTNTGLGYLKEIGFNYLQLMPVFGFGGVDEITKKDYNWGYNPVSYFSISNYLTKDLFNPIGGINELKELIDVIHYLNIGVTLDVVFNHVYDSDIFPLSILVPGYTYHTKKDGFMSNSSGCGNDINSTKLMVRRYIIDVLTYYKTELNVDGFRFDLMNLIDVDTLNLSKSTLKQIDEYNLVYGEGWNIPMELPQHLGGLAENFWELPGFSFFNDKFRNFLKSNFNCTEGGFILGKKSSLDELYSALTGYCVNEESFNSPRCSINYVECHDNYTLYDTFIKLKPTMTKEEIFDRLILALGMVAISQGIPFYHLGMEFGRTKKLEENSYNLSDEYNGVDFNKLKDYEEVINSFKNLLNLRKKYSFFRLNNKDDIKRLISIEKHSEGYQYRYYDIDNNVDYSLIIKNNYKEEVKYFAPGSVLVFNGRKEVEEEIETYTFNKPGIYLIRK